MTSANRPAPCCTSSSVAVGWSSRPNYRLAPRSPWPAQIEDVTRALGWVKTEIGRFGGDPSRVVISGGSAGGQLASLLALADIRRWRPEEYASLDDWGVRGVISFYGVLEMTGDDQLWRGMGRGLRGLLEGRVVQRPVRGNEALYEELSPYEQIRPDAPPFLVLQGVTDTLVEYNVARAFVERFRARAWAPIYYVELPFTQHSFDLTASPRTSATTRAAVAFAESVVGVRPPLRPELVASYQVPPTTLEVLSEGSWSDASALATRIGPYVVVTSDNPYSQPLGDDVNARRRSELRSQLVAKGADFFESRARDPRGVWPEERGCAVVGQTRESIRALALAWGQFAYYDVREGGVLVRESGSDVVLS